jgi:uncharacterized phage protein (TIGR02218 family)
MPTIDELANDEVTRLVMCWRIVRRDGVVLGFTAHDADITHQGQRYRSAPSLVPSAMIRSAGTSVDSIDVRGALSHAAVSENDLLAGRFDLAVLFMFMLDWKHPEAGQIDLGSGRLGSVSSDGNAFRVEVRGLTDALNRPIVEMTSPECRAELGDKRCRVTLRRFNRMSAVAFVQNEQIFEADGLSSYVDAYAYGRLRWVSGANSSVDSAIMASEILSETSFNVARVRLTLRDTLPAALISGDRFEIIFGCDKRYVTCLGRFGNQLNFRGEPFVPGVDALLRYPDA